VYLPPGYDPDQQYPLILWLHGIIEAETWFVDRDLCQFDKAMAQGKIPPAIIAIPNGRINPDFPPETPLIDDDFPGASWWARWDRGFCLESNWINHRGGRFRDYLTDDVLPFVMSHYSVRPEPQAHAVMGFSMAGWGAANLALKRKDLFAVMAVILPPLNLR